VTGQQLMTGRLSVSGGHIRSDGLPARCEDTAAMRPGCRRTENPARGFKAVVNGDPHRTFYDSQCGLTFSLFKYNGVLQWGARLERCHGVSGDRRRACHVRTVIAEVGAVRPRAIGLSRSADIGLTTHAHVMFRIAGPPNRSFPCNCPAHGR